MSAMIQKGEKSMSTMIGLVGGASGFELVEELHKKGYTAALVAGENGELGTGNADYVLTTDLRNIDTIRSFFKDFGVRHLIIGTGHRYAFKLAEELEKDGITPNVNIKASLIAKVKNDYKDLVQEKGFLSPAFFTILKKTDMPDLKVIEEKIGFPCVVKASIDTMYPQKANNQEELQAAIEEVLDSGSPVLIEQFIRGIDITVPVSVANGKAKAYAVCYYSKAEECDLKGFTQEEFMKEHLSKEDEAKVLDYCERLALASEFEGLPRFDAMALPGGDTYVLEVNSVGVTGISDHYEPYNNAVLRPLMKKGINLAEITVNTALEKFGLKMNQLRE